MGAIIHALGTNAGRPDCRNPCVVRQFRRIRPVGDPGRSRSWLELGPKSLVPRDPFDRDRDRGHRGARRNPLPVDRLGTTAQEDRRPDRLYGRLPRLLGTPVDLLRRRALGLYRVVRCVRPGGPGRVRARAPTPVKTRCSSCAEYTRRNSTNRRSNHDSVGVESWSMGAGLVGFGIVPGHRNRAGLGDGRDLSVAICETARPAREIPLRLLCRCRRQG